MCEKMLKVLQILWLYVQVKYVSLYILSFPVFVLFL
jgi:hypothetical protein